METKAHWERVYETKDTTQVSWFQPHLNTFLRLIEHSSTDKNAPLIDVGGGASTLAKDLHEAGYTNITVLDISASALQIAKEHIGIEAEDITWLEADINDAHLPDAYFDLWHDRAVFHFLTNPREQEQYVVTVKQSLKPDGHLIVATFDIDGPDQCSGLVIQKYSITALHERFGDDFDLLSSHKEKHRTPFGTEQQFVYCHWRKRRPQVSSGIVSESSLAI